MVAHLTEDLREDLLARWSESHRKHHTVTHLNEMLDAIGELADAGLVFDREAVELAAWFHDAIYEIGRDDNEERSAELARELLSTSPNRDEVARLVLVTKTHTVADGDINAAVLCDADLSVLGSAAASLPRIRRSGPRRVRRHSRRRVQTRTRTGAYRTVGRVRCFTPSQDARGGRSAQGATSPRRSASSLARHDRSLSPSAVRQSSCRRSHTPARHRRTASPWQPSAASWPARRGLPSG